MLCLKPFKMKTKNGMIFSVPCGRCMPCRLNRTAEWCLRLMYEFQQWDYASFVTLTYDDEHLPIAENGRSTLKKRDLQLFMKRLRRYSGLKLKFFACGEYGSEEKTHRPHYHLIIFGLDPLNANHRTFIAESWQKCDSQLWQFKRKHNSIDIVNKYDIAYVAGYVQKKLYGKCAKDEYKGIEPPFSLQSKGLGFDGFLEVETMIDFYNSAIFQSETTNKVSHVILGKNLKFRQIGNLS